MTTAASEKIDLLIYGPTKPVVDNGFSERFERYKCETPEDVERLAPDAELDDWLTAWRLHGGPAGIEVVEARRGE